MTDLNKIVDQLSDLTVIEAAELSKLLEEKWGVSAAAPVAVAAAGAPAEAGPPRRADRLARGRAQLVPHARAAAALLCAARGRAAQQARGDARAARGERRAPRRPCLARAAG